MHFLFLGTTLSFAPKMCGLLTPPQLLLLFERNTDKLRRAVMRLLAVDPNDPKPSGANV